MLHHNPPKSVANMSELIPSQFLEDAKHDDTLNQKLKEAKTIDDCVAIA